MGQWSAREPRATKTMSSARNARTATVRPSSRWAASMRSSRSALSAARRCLRARAAVSAAAASAVRHHDVGDALEGGRAATLVRLEAVCRSLHRKNRAGVQRVAREAHLEEVGVRLVVHGHVGRGKGALALWHEKRRRRRNKQVASSLRREASERAVAHRFCSTRCKRYMQNLQRTAASIQHRVDLSAIRRWCTRAASGSRATSGNSGSGTGPSGRTASEGARRTAWTDVSQGTVIIARWTAKDRAARPYRAAFLPFVPRSEG